MKLLITGTRKPSMEGLAKLLSLLQTAKCKYPELVILHGGAKGTDSEVEQWAKANEVRTRIIRPDYKKYHHKAAPLKRNTELVKLAGVVIALYGTSGKRGGTLDTATKTRKANKRLIEISHIGDISHYPAAPVLF